MIDLRERLQRLAEEAVPDDTTSSAPVPLISTPLMPRRRSSRLLAAAIVLVVLAVLAGTIAVVATRDRETRPAGATVTPLPASPLAAREGQTTVFTGREVIVWGGRTVPRPPDFGRAPTSDFADGAAYDVATGRWRRLAPSGAQARYDAVGVWTGSEMLVLGGQADPPALPRTQLPSVAYNPRTDRWRTLAPAPTCARGAAVSRDLVYVVGSCTSDAAEIAAVYDPARDRWNTLNSPPTGDSVSQLLAVDGHLVLWAGNAGAVYDIGADHWSRLLLVPTQDTIATTFAAAIDRSVVVVASVHDPRAAKGVVHTIVARYDLTTNQWSDTKAIDARPPFDATSSTADRSLVAWQSIGIGWYDVATGKSATAGRHDARLLRTEGSIVAIGSSRVFLWGGRTSEGLNSHDVATGHIVDLPVEGG
jgi:hypothetical protein